jgi:ABC-type dipeptide/oligopeptide/nickel transport system ATPase subunit
MMGIRDAPKIKATRPIVRNHRKREPFLRRDPKTVFQDDTTSLNPMENTFYSNNSAIVAHERSVSDKDESSYADEQARTSKVSASKDRTPR